MKRRLLLSIMVLAIVSGCISLSKQSVFDAPSDQGPPEGIGNFYALNIFDDNLGSEVWFTQSKNCLTVKLDDQVQYSGERSMFWSWNKTAGGCPWLGIGFGWDNWNPKDLSGILDKAAVQLKVRAVKDNINVLPLAAALEDYAGAQAWLGISKNTIQAPYISDEWTTILLPLADFNWKQNDASPDNIKQLIIQFEAEGELYVDEIKIVPYQWSKQSKE